jgi:hypothetical protein
MVGRETFSLRYENDSNDAGNLSDLYENFSKADQNSYRKQGTNQY